MENGYRVEVLILLRKLERLDKDQINEEERQEAEEVSESTNLFTRASYITLAKSMAV